MGSVGIGNPSSAPDGRRHVTDSYVRTEALRLLSAAKCVLFDFDGPLCGLFDQHPAPGVAGRLRARAKEHFQAHVTAAWESVDDPQVIWTNAAKTEPRSQVVAELEELLTAEELVAAKTATATEGADRLIRQLSAAGCRLAVTTNNSASAALFYLRRMELTEYFGEHVHGRMPDPQLLKPDPHCLRRALETTGSIAAESLMIGDSVADYQAAQKAGVAFLGYVRSEIEQGALEREGASVIVNSISELLPALDAVAPGLRQE
jgi:phosphoglycolate phosphatase